MPHGYVFEVSPDAGETTGRSDQGHGPDGPRGRRRSTRSAAPCILTEDDRNQAGLYKFVPTDSSKKLGALEQGGTL